MSSIGEHHVQDTLDERQEQSEAYKGHKKDHQQGNPRMGGIERRNDQSEQAFSPPLIQVPQRRASVGSAQDLDEQDYSLLRIAFEMNLPCEVLQRNHKREWTASRRRYEQYKQGTTLRHIKNLGATWADMVWDFTGGYITFNKAAASNAVIEQLVDEWMEARQRPSRPAAYVSSSGKLVAPGPLMSFKESIQQDDATLAVEQVEQLTHREQRILQQAIGRETLEQFAHNCAARIRDQDFDDLELLRHRLS